MLNLVTQVNQKIDVNFEAINSKLANAGNQSDNIASNISSMRMIVGDLYQALIDEITNIHEKLLSQTMHHENLFSDDPFIKMA
jgi:hypothetical protein